MEPSTDLEGTGGLMARFTRATGAKVLLKALEHSFGPTSACTKVNGKRTICMVSGSILGLMVESILANLKVTRNLAMAFINGPMVDSIKDNGY